MCFTAFFSGIWCDSNNFFLKIQMFLFWYTLSCHIWKNVEKLLTFCFKIANSWYNTGITCIAIKIIIFNLVLKLRTRRRIQHIKPVRTKLLMFSVDRINIRCLNLSVTYRHYGHYVIITYQYWVYAIQSPTHIDNL